MSTKVLFPWALGLALLGVSTIRAQYAPAPSTTDPTHVPAPATEQPAPAPSADRAPAGLSNWITYAHPECCGPIGGNGPSPEELYFRTGPSVPIEGKLLGHILDIGWDISGGARSMLFNPQMNAAWTIDLGLTNINYQGQRSDIEFPLHVLVPSGTTVAAVDITTSLRN